MRTAIFFALTLLALMGWRSALGIEVDDVIDRVSRELEERDMLAMENGARSSPRKKVTERFVHQLIVGTDIAICDIVTILCFVNKHDMDKKLKLEAGDTMLHI